MSSGAVHAGVMKGIARALLFVLTGVALTASVCDADCQSYEYLENNLLRDHWYEMKNYTRAGEEVTEEHEFLSVFNLLCSTIQANEAFYTETLRCSKEKTKRGKIVSVYVEMVNSLVIHSKLTISDVGQLCKYNSCLKSYGTSFINITQFRDIYHKLCESPRVIPACPAPPPSPSPSLSPSPSPSPQSTTAAAVRPTMPSPAPAAAVSPTAPSPAQQKTSSQPSHAKENSTDAALKDMMKDGPVCSENQRFLVISLVLNVILLVLLLIIGLYHMRKQHQPPKFQGSVPPECMSLQYVNTETATQSLDGGSSP